jgi:WD40 repeat protein
VSLGASGAVAISPDGSLLAVGEDDGVTRLVAIDGSGVLGSFVGHWGAVSSLAFSPDGKFFASGATEEAIHLFNFEEATSGQWLHPALDMGAPNSGPTAKAIWPPPNQMLRGHPGGVGAVVFSPDGRQLASCSKTNVVKLWNVDTGEETARLIGHGKTVNSVAFSPNGAVLASSSSSTPSDGALDLWSVPTGQLVGTIRVIRDQEAVCVIAPTGHISFYGDMQDVPICRVGAFTHPFDLCEERFKVPDLLAKIFLNDHSYLDP